MRPLIRLMRLLWMRRASHSLLFVLWLLYAPISHLSGAKRRATSEWQRFLLPLCSPRSGVNLHFCGGQVGETLLIFGDAECALVSQALQITSRAPCAPTAPAPWTVKIHTLPLETLRGWRASTQRAATWRWSPPPTARCPLEARPPSWAAPAGMSMMLVSVLLLWCAELSRALWLMSSLVVAPQCEPIVAV